MNWNIIKQTAALIKVSENDNQVQKPIFNVESINHRTGIIGEIDKLKDTFENMYDSVKSIGDNLGQIVHWVSKIIYYITHPAALAWVIWTNMVRYSLIICLGIFMVGIFLYLIGYKKGALYSRISLFSYLTIQIFNSLIGG